MQNEKEIRETYRRLTLALIEKGLIKSRTVKVTEAEAERLLNKKA